MLNNPLIPGDPYSYDLKWLVAKVKEILAQLGTLDEAIEAKIFEGFLEHSIVQFKTVEEMLAADITDGSIVLTLGYHEAGDQGGLFYLVKDFNPSQCSLDYFLTMDNNAQIAIPVIVTPYVTPEMFGAYGDGTADDADALEKAVSFDEVRLTKEYAIGHTVEVTAKSFITGGKLKALTPLENGIVYVNANNVSIDRVNFEGTGVETTLPHGWNYSAVYAYQADGLSVTNCHIENMEGSGVFIRETNGANIDGNVIENMVGKEGACIAFGYGINNEKISNAIIHANTCDANSRFGIHIQGWGEDFLVSENIVKNCYGYGIMAYLDANGQDVLSRVVISDNVVENIHYNSASGIYDGMGIYCQTVQGLTVTGNIVKNALLDRPDTSAPNRTLEPAAISLNGSTELTCSSNVVIASSIDGIGVANVSTESKASILESNIIVDCTNSIYIRSTKHLNVNGNYIGGDCSTAITVYSSSNVITEDINIIGNVVEGTNTTAISIYEGTGSESRNITVKSNALKGSSANMLSATYVNGLQIDANTFTSTSNGGTNAYILSVNHAEDVVITNNVTLQDGSNTFGRGFNLANITGGLVANNRIPHVSQVAYSIAQTNNSNVEFLGNITPRSPYPFYTAIAIGQDPMSDNYKVVTSGTSAPASGTFDRGSICLNKTPAAGGVVGWICTSGGTPGTWKAFGTIAN